MRIKLKSKKDWIVQQLIGWITISVSLMAASCGSNTPRLLPSESSQLQEYIDRSEMRLVRDSLIACALGADQGFFINPSSPVSILYYPEGDISEVGYFETSSVDVNPDDLSGYTYKSLPDEALFNGYLRRFVRERIDRNIWCRVTYVKNGNLHISNAIRIKYNDQPTESNNALLTLNQQDVASPLFQWETGQNGDNAIYFQVILDDQGDLLSGTYTFDRFFKFYDLSNVVLNIRDITPAPSLLQDTDYRFVLMGVSKDNWVNLLMDQPFSTR